MFSRVEAGSGLGRPAPYPSGARPRAPVPAGTRAVAGDAAEGGDAARGGHPGAAAELFSEKSHAWGPERQGGEESGVPGREPLGAALHNMASSASLSAAGAEGTSFPAQVSAAPPLPVASFRPGAGIAARGRPGAGRVAAGSLAPLKRSPATARREEGTLCAVGDPAAPEGAGSLPFRAESGTLRPPRRASILGEVGPRDVGGLCSGTFASAPRKRGPGLPTPSPRSTVSGFGVLGSPLQ